MSRTKVLAILAGKLFDSQERCILEDQVIMIDQELGVILDVLNLGVFKRLHGKDDGIDFMDLGHLTIIPGLVDVHVHCKNSSSWFSPSHSITTHHPSIFACLCRDAME